MVRETIPISVRVKPNTRLSRKAPSDADTVLNEEFTELLGDDERTMPKAIDQEASNLEITLPEEATVVDVGE